MLCRPSTPSILAGVGVTLAGLSAFLCAAIRHLPTDPSMARTPPWPSPGNWRLS